MKPHRIAGVSAFTTEARFSSMPNDTGLPPWFGSRPAWMCQAGLSGCSAAGCAASRAAFARYSSTARGITSKYSRLARCGCVEHELRQAFRRGVAQPFLDRQAVALRLADLLRLLVEEQFIGEAVRRRAAENAADAPGQPHASRSGPCPTSRNRRRARTSASPSRPSTAACSAPPFTEVSNASPLSGSRQTTVPAAGSRRSIGTCMTMPVRGWIGRIGE